MGILLRAGVRGATGGGGRTKIENSSRRHPLKFSLKRFLAVRRSWRGSRVAYFWVTSFRKKFIGSRGEAPCVAAASWDCYLPRVSPAAVEQPQRLARLRHRRLGSAIGAIPRLGLQDAQPLN